MAKLDKTSSKQLYKWRILQCIILVIAMLVMWVLACGAETYVGPQVERADMSRYSHLISLEELTLEDYTYIYQQTGVGKAGLETLVDKRRVYRLRSIQDYFYGVPSIHNERLSVVRHLERSEGVYAQDSGESILPQFIAEDGDIIVTLSNYIGGWRYGHAGLIVDADRGKVLESIDYNEPSCIQDLDHWKEYPSWVILRPNGLTREQRAAVAEYAYKHLQGIKYNLLVSTRAGDVGPGGAIEDIVAANETGQDRLEYDVMEATQCAHIAWYAYYLAGIDLDDDWTDYVTPGDLLESKEMELVMEYGFFQERFKGRE